MRTIVYTGPGHVLAVGELRIPRGRPTEVTEEVFRQLQRDPSMTLQVVPRRREPKVKPAGQAEHNPANQAGENAESGEEEVTSHG